jgi:hypothetical protein
MPPRILDRFRPRRSGDTVTPFWGKHRGTVVQNLDPSGLARLQVQVPAVLGAVSVWALPALADARLANYVPPEVGAAVWVEFEGGDPSRPIWTGFFCTR